MKVSLFLKVFLSFFFLLNYFYKLFLYVLKYVSIYTKDIYVIKGNIIKLSSVCLRK